MTGSEVVVSGGAGMQGKLSWFETCVFSRLADTYRSVNADQLDFRCRSKGDSISRDEYSSFTWNFFSSVVSSFENLPVVDCKIGDPILTLPMASIEKLI